MYFLYTDTQCFSKFSDTVPLESPGGTINKTLLAVTREGLPELHISCVYEKTSINWNLAYRNL